jgi:hypothetical protein
MFTLLSWSDVHDSRACGPEGLLQLQQIFIVRALFTAAVARPFVKNYIKEFFTRR